MIMKSYRFSIIAFAFFLGLSCTQTLSSKNAQPLMINQCDTTITIAQNASAVIQLPLTSTTGYIWKLIRQSDETVLEKISDQEIITPMEKNDMDGNTEIQTFNIKATQKVGTTVLTFHYMRSFERDKPPLKTCQMTISVQ